MLAVIVNTAAVALGGALGILLKKGIPDKIKDAIMKGIALCLMYIGISGALEGTSALVAIVSVVIGAVAGTLLDLDGKLLRLGGKIEALVKKGGEHGSFSNGLVTASLLFCVGAMSVVGSLEAGLIQKYDTIYTKSLIDFISAIVLAASLGAGVVFSAVFVFIYQGAITLLATLFAPLLTDVIIADMTCVGSILILGLGFNLLGLAKLKVMNYVPAIFIAIGISYLYHMFF